MMSKYIWIVCFAVVFLASCTGGSKADVSNNTKAAKTANKSMPNKQIKTAPIGLNKPKMASGAIQIDISSTSAKKGEEACLSFTAKSFKSILGLQHSILFDQNQLKFKTIKSFGLPGLSLGSFGTTKAEEGSLNFLWFDMNVKGVTVADGNVLYDLCFDVMAKKGTICEVTISDKPLKMEVVGPNKSKLNLESTAGKISVE
jgi:hypothetical protein